MVLIKIWICNGFHYFGILKFLIKIWICNGFDYFGFLTFLLNLVL